MMLTSTSCSSSRAAMMSGPGCRVAWTAASCGSERMDHHNRHTVRSRQRSLAGRRSRISYRGSRGRAPMLDATRARLFGAACGLYDDAIAGRDREKKKRDL